MTQEEKWALRKYFLTKAAWRRHIKAVLCIVQAQYCPPVNSSRFSGEDFLKDNLVFKGTAVRRREKRERRRRPCKRLK